MVDFNWILLAISGVVLMSYLFDVASRHSRIPSVILLIMSGIGLRLGLDLFHWEIPLLNLVLPVLGTLGLILIVLDSALELQLNRDAKDLIVKASLSAILGIAVCGLLIAAGIHYYFAVPWLHAWVVATPFAVISSAVAIPASVALHPKMREFVVYESALSDIFGVLLFYALLDAERSVTSAILNVPIGVILSTVIGAALGYVILLLIERIVAHVRFVPMIFSLVLVYAGSKLLHLAPLVSVLAVGLMINNLPLLKRLPGIRKVKSVALTDDVASFKHLTAEMTFLVRTFFFVLLGYSTSLTSLAHPMSWVLAVVILLIAFTSRFLLLRGLLGGETRPLLWFAPRGLITVLLFLSIPPSLQIAVFPEGTLMLAVLGSVLILTIGNIIDGKKSLASKPPDEVSEKATP